MGTSNGGWRKGREKEITIGGERYELTKLKQSASQQMKAPRFTYLDVLAHGFLWKRRENEPLAAGGMWLITSRNRVERVKKYAVTGNWCVRSGG